MLRATTVKARDSWHGDAVDSVVLDFDDRHRRRIAMTGVRGLEFLLDLPDAIMLRGGDALLLEDGRLVEVVSAPETLLEIRCADTHQLVRMAWHLGNRHLPTQILGLKLRIRKDHVIEEMVKGLGAKVLEIQSPFDPEGGAYAAHVATHGHDHHHDHAHSHHAHSAEDHVHGAGVPAVSHEPHKHEDHAHGSACGCGHDHHDHDLGSHGHKHGHKG
jgi:urease accessory protein